MEKYPKEFLNFLEEELFILTYSDFKRTGFSDYDAYFKTMKNNITISNLRSVVSMLKRCRPKLVVMLGISDDDADMLLMNFFITFKN